MNEKGNNNQKIVNPDTDFDPEEFPAIGGIPIDFTSIAKVPYGRVTVTGKESGDSIIVSVNDYEIQLHTSDENYFFKAEWYDEPDPEDPEEIVNIISFDIKTIREIDGKKVRHPDFRARELGEASIAYFESLYGQLGGIDFHFEGQRYIPKVGWMPPSDNYTIYYEEKAKALSQGKSEDEAKTEAALSSWSGKNFAKPRGFTRVRYLEETDIPEGDDPNEDGLVQAGIQEIRGQFVK